MNIYILDTDPVLAAEYYCDAHVVQGIYYYTQTLCNVFHRMVYQTFIPSKPRWSGVPLKALYPFGSQTQALVDSSDFFYWFLCLTERLLYEYTYRFGRTHKNEEVVEWVRRWCPRLPLPTTTGIKRYLFSYDIPPDYKRLPSGELRDITEAYRLFYNHAFLKTARWTRRQPPYWFYSIYDKNTRSSR